eukprot:TRINITY_DN8014_c0_g1_i2.p1 TRINITY_DN8014_c0_g1~~TRINITY_DN8014_c0_g1_i2.p1  ORF type:complete len:517 (+),score=75.37 TRINITY_DN8014_c0_g1_i2:61-1551(+)
MEANSHGAASGRNRPGTEIVQLLDGDAPLLMSSQFRALDSIAKASGADMLLRTSYCLEITGLEDCRARARLYLRLMLSQRAGPIQRSELGHSDDFSLVEVPTVAIGCVTGKRACRLRRVEGIFGVIMLFIERFIGLTSSCVDSLSIEPNESTMVILGRSERQRYGATLFVMEAIEEVVPGHFAESAIAATVMQPSITGVPSSPQMPSDEDCFATEALHFEMHQRPRANGRQGLTREKVFRASGCIIVLIGAVAYLAGTLSERRKAREYLTWYINQDWPTCDLDVAARDDVDVIEVPSNVVGFLCVQLTHVEQTFGTCCVIPKTAAPTDLVKVFIFGCLRARTGAKARVVELVGQKLHAPRSPVGEPVRQPFSRSAFVAYSQAALDPLRDWACYEDPVSTRVWLACGEGPQQEAFFEDDAKSAGWQAYFDEGTGCRWFWHDASKRWFWDPRDRQIRASPDPAASRHDRLVESFGGRSGDYLRPSRPTSCAPTLGATR